jgi:hypothetical protein
MRFPASLVTTAFLGFLAPLARGKGYTTSDSSDSGDIAVGGTLPGLFETLVEDGNHDTFVTCALSVDFESFLTRFQGQLSKSLG